jgi:hypothetical protein
MEKERELRRERGTNREKNRCRKEKRKGIK